MDTKDNSAASFTVAQVNKAIDALSKAQMRTVKLIGDVLVMSVYASIVGIDGDNVGVAKALLANLRKSVKSTAIIAFLEQYGKLAYVQGGIQHFNVGEAKKLQWTPEYSKEVQEAALTWESLKAKAPVTDFDVEAKIRAIIADAAKRQKDGKPVKNADILADLPAVLAKHSTLKANADLVS